RRRQVVHRRHQVEEGRRRRPQGRDHGQDGRDVPAGGAGRGEAGEGPDGDGVAGGRVAGEGGPRGGPRRRRGAGGGAERRGGEAPAHNGIVSAIDKDGKSVTITEGKKGGDESKVELKLTQDSKQAFSGVTTGGAKIQVGQHATVWVKSDAKDTVSIGHFQVA